MPVTLEPLTPAEALSEATRMLAHREMVYSRQEVRRIVAGLMVLPEAVREACATVCDSFDSASDDPASIQMAVNAIREIDINDIARRWRERQGVKG